MITAFILIAFILLTTGCQKNSQPEICFSDNCFDVEIAKTQTEQSRGLSNRESLAQNQGMLFVFEKPDIYSFWMKDTLIPLDMIWLNQDLEIEYIEHNAQPCQETCPSIVPPQKASYVLEINANLANKLDFKIEDKATLHNY